MTKIWKFTSKYHFTKNNTHWVVNRPNKIENKEIRGLCTSSWLHAYEHPVLAVLFRKRHINSYYNSYVFWEGEGEIGITDGTKCGCKEITLNKIVDLPILTERQLIAFVTLLTLRFVHAPAFKKWATAFLQGKKTEQALRNSARKSLKGVYNTFPFPDSFSIEVISDYVWVISAHLKHKISFAKYAEACLKY
jgi:hypothetical protein